ncbi:hypothetical protein TRFO_06617 [Tritrichomonas foetus]|uniref:Uncharacterized protein n=1 Tax=Tritrichomonas foetus TaxID=1144522 RepID=A0A1J4K0X7_9EUKA|nr:hypothetical protein TRFO_06617 [Tritrichomonas foetus]|eukprot:OHT03406.1 hypothetical protein TRFO_06617 [Tritrichomonas foetus]
MSEAGWDEVFDDDDDDDDDDHINDNNDISDNYCKINDKENDTKTSENESKSVGTKKSLRQFFRYKNEVRFQKKEDDSVKFNDANVGRILDFPQYKDSRKTIRHTKDPLQNVIQFDGNNKRSREKEYSSFRNEIFVEKKWLCFNWKCISNRTFIGHSQMQVIYMLIVLDLLTLLGILVFHFRGDVLKLNTTSSLFSSKIFNINNYSISNEGFSSTTKFIFNSTLVFNETILNQTNGANCKNLIATGSVLLGDILINYNNQSSSYNITTADNKLNIAGHLHFEDSAEIDGNCVIGGLIFNQTHCFNCNFDSMNTAKTLSNNKVQSLNVIKVPKYFYSSLDGQSILVSQNQICIDEKCHYLMKENSILLFEDYLIPENFGTYGKVLFALFYDDQIIRICDNGIQTFLLNNHEILYTYHDFSKESHKVPELSYLVSTLDNEIYQMFVFNDLIHIFSINGTKVEVHCQFGQIFKMKALLNDINEIVVFLQTGKGIATFRIGTEMTISEILLQFPDFYTFDVAIRDFDLIFMVGAKLDG